MSAAVELIGVTRSFGPVEVLKGIDLSVPRGQVVAVYGRSGSGKTTLLNLLGGLDRPTGGKIRVAGRELSLLSTRELDELRRRYIGFVFQSYGLLSHLSAWENVLFGLRLAGIPRQQWDEAAQAALEAVVMALEDEGWKTEHVADGSAGLRRAASGEHDLIILDVRLPGLSGFDICRELRLTTDVPVLFLTARSEEMDKVIGLELGADDYLAKPFGLHELKARVRALLRRSRLGAKGAEKHIRVHDLVIMPERRSVYRGDERIQLTNSEFLLLLTMAQRPGMVFTREMLIEALWESDFNMGSALTVNVHVRNLRDKLGDDPEAPRYIETVRGVGYRLIREQP